MDHPPVQPQQGAFHAFDAVEPHIRLLKDGLRCDALAVPQPEQFVIAIKIWFAPQLLQTFFNLLKLFPPLDFGRKSGRVGQGIVQRYRANFFLAQVIFDDVGGHDFQKATQGKLVAKFKALQNLEVSFEDLGKRVLNQIFHQGMVSPASAAEEASPNGNGKYPLEAGPEFDPQVCP
ncbi:MAG TPA: hypothetical protein VKQ89_02200 [Candidatus Angelobacter sp.]|nr:hypothetical protein [Candidatus Angelobacter sp.]